jgi:hypothetical protein
MHEKDKGYHEKKETQGAPQRNTKYSQAAVDSLSAIESREEILLAFFDRL